MAMQLPPYEQWLAERLSRFERWWEKLSPTDERLDYIAMALQLIASQLAAPPPQLQLDGRIDALLEAVNRLSLVSYPTTAHCGKATRGKDKTLIDQTAFWQDDIWVGYEVAIVSGTGIGQIRKIESNNANSLTLETAWTTDPDETSIYVIRRRRGIDLEAQSTGMYLQPEWAAKEGIDKEIILTVLLLAADYDVYAEYTVPANKKYYICALAFYIAAYDVADRDKNQIGAASLYVVSPTSMPAVIGGNGGGALVLPKPAVIGGGQTVRLHLRNHTSHTVKGRAMCWGYEIED